MASNLERWSTQDTGNLVWVEYDAYAHKVFAGSRSGWYQDAAGYAGTIAQAFGILRTAVLSVPAAAPFLAIADETGGPADALHRCLDAPAPLDFLTTAIDALHHRLGGRADLALALPSPGDLLMALGAGSDVRDDFDTLDDVALSLTGILRALSGKPVSVLKLEFAALPGAVEIDICQSLADAARHYGWKVAVLLGDATATDAAAAVAPLRPDVILLPGVAGAVLAAGGRRNLGGGLDTGFWTGRPTGDLPPLRFGQVPPHTEPEIVVRRMAEL